jgi:hypothetical protein
MNVGGTTRLQMAKGYTVIVLPQKTLLIGNKETVFIL